MKITSQQYDKYKEYLGNLRIKIATNDGLLIIDESFKKKWLERKSTILRAYLENKIREKFKLISALEKLRDSNEKRNE